MKSKLEDETYEGDDFDMMPYYSPWLMGISLGDQEKGVEMGTCDYEALDERMSNLEKQVAALAEEIGKQEPRVWCDQKMQSLEQRVTGIYEYVQRVSARLLALSKYFGVHFFRNESGKIAVIRNDQAKSKCLPGDLICAQVNEALERLSEVETQLEDQRLNTEENEEEINRIIGRLNLTLGYNVKKVGEYKTCHEEKELSQPLCLDRNGTEIYLGDTVGALNWPCGVVVENLIERPLSGLYCRTALQAVTHVTLGFDHVWLVKCGLNNPRWGRNEYTR